MIDLEQIRNEIKLHIIITRLKRLGYIIFF